MYILFTVPNHSQFTRFGNRETRPCLFPPISPSIIGCFHFLFHLLFFRHPSLSFAWQTCSFVRQMRSTLLHVSFFRSSDAFFRLADAFYSTACIVLSFVRRVLSSGRCVLLYCMCHSFVRQTRSFA